MEWYQYLATFFSGAFLSNAIPHFVKGVCGDKFPTPFAKPPGKGLSSPVVNTLWGSLNILIGYILWHVSTLKPGNHPGMIVFFIGFVLMAVMSSLNFVNKDKEQKEIPLHGELFLFIKHYDIVSVKKYGHFSN